MIIKLESGKSPQVYRAVALLLKALPDFEPSPPPVFPDTTIVGDSPAADEGGGSGGGLSEPDSEQCDPFEWNSNAASTSSLSKHHYRLTRAHVVAEKLLPT